MIVFGVVSGVAPSTARPDAGRPFLQLPPHMSEGRVLSDLDYLITTLNVGLLSPEDQERLCQGSQAINEVPWPLLPNVGWTITIH